VGCGVVAHIEVLRVWLRNGCGVVAHIEVLRVWLRDGCGVVAHIEVLRVQIEQQPIRRHRGPGDP